jgi:murein DD-endopeptidase MepM/ murein hydrolase activator NlpD
MKKIFLILSIIGLFNVSVFSKTFHWEKGMTLLSFLKKHHLPKSLYYGLDHEDKDLMEEIRAGQKYFIEKDKTIIIPVTDELQIKIIKSRKKGKHKLFLEPIPFEVLKGSIFLKVKKNLKKELYKKTHSRALFKSLKLTYNHRINFNKMRKGDSVSIFYEQKRRKGIALNNPKIVASLVVMKKKKFYSFLTKHDKYYDSMGKKYEKSKRFITPYIRPIGCKTRISSRFTHRRFHPILKRYRAHLGIDYANCTGTKIKATSKGKIVYRGWKGGYGKCIIIQHPNGVRSLYAHMSRFRKGLRVGSRVPQGKIIGYVGSTGRSTGAHLHFGMYKNGKAINPARYIRIKKHKKSTRLKGKAYRELRKSVIKFRPKFKKVRKTGGEPLYIKKGNRIFMSKEL